MKIREKEYLEQRDRLVYGETLDSFPAQLYDSMLKEQTGFATDLMNQVALEMEQRLRFNPSHGQMYLPL